MHCSSSHAVVVSNIQNRRRLAQMLATIFLKQKEENWQQMLAQGQSSSAKRKKIGSECWFRANISKKKKKHLIEY
ncbi:hypothetical protein, partial [Streptococcus mitis]|uniref:hypothetical protein n=1 Tax=Streptococcus mitis TaxID=28037 RepID=UPI0021B7FE80